MDILAGCNLPLRAKAVRLLAEERMRRMTLQTYQGDVQWSILTALHGMGSGKAHIPSYSDMVEKVYKTGKARSGQRMTNAETIARVEEMINMFST